MQKQVKFYGVDPEALHLCRACKRMKALSSQYLGT